MEKKNYTSDQKYFQIKLCTKHFHRLDPYIFLFFTSRRAEQKGRVGVLSRRLWLAITVEVVYPWNKAR